MITYVFGASHGFTFYGNEIKLQLPETPKDYFKRFWRYSRKGRYLVVNRRNDGLTFYTFLCYGLLDVNYKINSFFGMSVVLDNDEYASNFVEVYEWFDYVFDKVVSRGVLFNVNSLGQVQFKDQMLNAEAIAAEVGWLKSNIPNFFLKSPSAGMSRYDSSFAAHASAEAKKFSCDASQSEIIRAFKNHRWIYVSSEVKASEAPIVLDAGSHKPKEAPASDFSEREVSEPIPMVSIPIDSHISAASNVSAGTDNSLSHLDTRFDFRKIWIYALVSIVSMMVGCLGTIFYFDHYNHQSPIHQEDVTQEFQPNLSTGVPNNSDCETQVNEAPDVPIETPYDSSIKDKRRDQIKTDNGDDKRGREQYETNAGAPSTTPSITVTVNGHSETFNHSKNLAYKKGTEVVLTSSQSINFSSRKTHDVSMNKDRTRMKIIVTDGTKVEAKVGKVNIIIRGWP